MNNRDNFSRDSVIPNVQKLSEAEFRASVKKCAKASTRGGKCEVRVVPIMNENLEVNCYEIYVRPYAGWPV